MLFEIEGKSLRTPAAETSLPDESPAHAPWPASTSNSSGPRWAASLRRLQAEKRTRSDRSFRSAAPKGKTVRQSRHSERGTLIGTNDEFAEIYQVGRDG